MNFIKIFENYRTLLNGNKVVTRQISVSAPKNNLRWRLQKGYPKHWSDRGVFTDGPDFSYVDGRPTPYSSGQRARLLRQKEYTEKIIDLLNAVKYAKKRRQDFLNNKKAEAELSLTRKLKWKGLKPAENDEI